MYKKQFKIKDIAEIVEVNRDAVSSWIKLYQKGGLKALMPKGKGRPSGSGRMLTTEQEKEIQNCITDKLPDQLKLPFALWTRDAARLLILGKFGVKIAIRTVGAYLKRWGFTPQKTIRRTYERCEKRVQKWLTDDYPNIKERAQKEDAEIHWGDETGLRSDDVNGRGYAPKGKTPVCRAKGSPERINMTSTVTNQGKVRFMFYKEKMNADMLIKFMTRLVKSTDKKIFLILDYLRVPHSKKVKEVVGRTKN